MKTMKLKSFFIAALVLTGFAGNAWAQRDITSQYITNATLSNGTNGWTKSFTKTKQVTDPADAFSNSVRGNNTVGYASEAYAGWGELIQTAYSMKQTITLPAGNYRLVCYAFFRQGQAYNTNSSKSLAFLKAGSSQVALKTLGSITAAGYANSQAEGANCFDSKMYRNVVEFSVAADNTQIEIGVEGTFDEMRSWCIVGQFELFDLDDVASVSSPTDVTYAITNPGFEYRNLTGWTTVQDNTSEHKTFWYMDNDALSNKAGKAWVESYQGGGIPDGRAIYQTLTGLDDGLYEVTVYGHLQQGSGSNGFYLYANSDKVAIGSTDQDYSVRTTVTDNQLTIKLGTEGCNGNWAAFDKVRLKFYGDPLQAYKDLLDSKVAEAQAIVDGGTLRTGAANQLQTIIDDNDNDDDAFTTEAEFNTAVSNIESGMATANQIAAAYPAYDAYKAKFIVLENGVEACASKTTFDNAIATCDAAVTNATSAATVNEQVTNIYSAAMTFMSTTDNHQFDITFMASQLYSDWKKKDGSAAGIVQDQFLTNRPAEIPSFAESYETTCETTGTVLYQTIENLPAGYYQVGMYAAAMFTSGRGFNTEATEGDANRTFAFAGDLNDNSSILRTGAPISFNTVRDFNDLTTLDVNVHLASAGNLTYGVQKDDNGSNWHFAQIISIVYSNQPDLTNLIATRDALVAEAEGLLNGSVDYLTSAQQTALQSAITAGNDADDFESLNTVTLTTLPNAINTAKQQVQLVKENRVLMIAALERFENEYNLADGTDYSRATMSAGAWTTLLAKVNAVSTALDDVSQATSYGTIKDELVAQMDATDASLRIFKSYKAMADGTTALSIAEGTTYSADSYMDTDATEQTAIAALNTAFETYAATQASDIDMSGFLGANLDFSAEEGNALNTENDNNIHKVTGWEVAYADADQWAVLQTHQSANDEKLYIRKNWGSAATTLKAFKEKMLPVGKYRLSFSWNSDLANMNNLSQYKLGETAVALGENNNATLTYDFEVTGSAQPFDLTFGFQKTGSGNTPAQIVVDDVALICLGVNSQLLVDYDPAALWFDATDAKYAAAKNVEVTPTAVNQIIKAAAADQFSGLTKNVIVGGTCANLVITDGSPLEVQEAFTATSATYTRTMSNAWGTVILPFDLTSNADVQLYRLKDSDDSDMTFELIDAAEANSPVTFKKLTDAGLVTFSATDAAISTTTGSQNDLTTASGWTSEGSYTAQSIEEFTGIYYIASNKFWAADGTMTVNPFRAIFRSNGGGSVKAFSIRVVDTTTDIAGIEEANADAPLYNLAGQRVQCAKPQTGVYLRNGKKIIIR